MESNNNNNHNSENKENLTIATNGNNSNNKSSKSSSFTKFNMTPKRMRLLKYFSIGIIGPAIPILVWWNWSNKQRQEKINESESKIRIPNVQTIDDLLIERCRPGDVLLFDRRYETCCSSPFAALSCILARTFLCNPNDTTRVTMSDGKYDHCGIVVPGYGKTKKEILDPSNLLLLEATSGSGIVARPLLNRLEISQSRSVLLLPLSMPGEKRHYNENNDNYEPTPNEVATELLVRKKLESFRDVWTGLSTKNKYQNAHSTLCIIGSIAYGIGIHTHIPSPTSPSAWFVTMALQDAKIAQPKSDSKLKNTKAEDFLHDHRFQDHDVIHLRPGWKFLQPVSMRET